MAKFDIVAVFKIEGLTNINKAFKDIGSSADDVGRSFKNFTGAVGDAAQKIALIGTAAVGAAAGIVALVKGNAALAEGVENTAQKTGLAIEQIQTIQKIAEGAGINPETVNKGLQKLTKNLRDLKDPTSAAGKNLKELDAGLAGSIKNAKNTDDAFQIVKAALQGITDETKAANIAQAFFGKGGIDLLPVLQQNSKEYDDQARKLKAFGVILTDVQNKTLSEADNAFDDVGFAIQGVGKQLSVILAPAVTAAANAFAGFIVTNRQAFLDFAGAIVGQVTTVVKDLFKLMSDGPEAEGVSKRAKDIYNGFISIKDAVVTAFGIAKGALDLFFAALDPIAKILGAGDGKTLGIAVILLQVTGLLKVFGAGLGLATSSVNLFFTAFKLGPAILKDLSLAFTALGPAAVTVFNLIKTTFITNLGLMGGAATVLESGLAILAGAFEAVWLAVTGPVGLVIAAIVAIGAAIFFVVDKTIGWGKVIDAVKGFFVSLGATALSILTAIIGYFTSAGQTIIDFFNGLGIIIGQSFQKAFDYIKSIFLAFINYVVTTFKSFFTPLVDFLKNLFTPAFEFLKNSFTSVAKFITDGISNIIKGMVAAVKSVIDPIFSGIKSTVDSVVSAVKSITGTGTQARIENTYDKNAAANKTTGKFGPGFAGGGAVSGPGTSTSDSINAWLSNGEFVMKAKAVRNLGVNFLNRLNTGFIPGVRRFAEGGLVGLDNLAASALGGGRLGASSAQLSPAAAASGRPLNLHLGNGKIIKARTDNDTARMLERDLRRSDNAKAAQLPAWYK